MTQENTQQEQSQETPQLGLIDIQNVVQIIDVASRRGAFQGNELSQVGQVRDKLEGFLNHHAVTANPEDQAEEDGEQKPAAQGGVNAQAGPASAKG